MVGDGAAYLQKEIVGTAPIVVTNSAGNITLSAPSIASFNYVTFTRRLTGSNLIVAATTKNPFSLTDFPVGSWANLDPSSGFVAATGRFVVPYTGYYKIEGVFNLLGSGGVARVVVFLRKNGSNIFQTLDFNATNASPQSLPAVSFSYVDQASVVGDYYDILIQTTTHDVSVETGSSFSVHRIQA
jgi:hypothetical protein